MERDVLKKAAVSSKGRCNAMNDHSKEGSWVAFVVHGCRPERRWSCGSGGSVVSRSATSVGHSVGSREQFTTSCQPVGVSPPPSRTRSRRSLTLTEREEISRGLARGYSVRQIGVRLSRAPSTISREVRRNGGRRQYRASVADARAWDRTRRPKPCRLALSPLLRALVAEKLAADWSPQQIAGWLKRTFPKDPCLVNETLSGVGLAELRVAHLSLNDAFFELEDWSVISRRGSRPWRFNSFRKNRVAARRLRRDCTRMSRTSPSSSTARHRYCCCPWIFTKSSSRYQVSPWRPRRRRNRLA